MPRSGSTRTAGPLQVGGVAFSGDRGISQVEVSFDGGSTWQEASALPSLSPYAWVLWSLQWDAPPGEHQLLVRAYDSAGRGAGGDRRRAVSRGGTGYHSIVMKVEPAKPSG